MTVVKDSRQQRRCSCRSPRLMVSQTDWDGTPPWRNRSPRMKNSSSGSSFIDMAFALRGAPCGDDPGRKPRRRDYHPSNRSLDDQPMIRERSSALGADVSAAQVESRLSTAVSASSNDTPCLRRLTSAFWSSQWNLDTEDRQSSALTSAHLVIDDLRTHARAAPDRRVGRWAGRGHRRCRDGQDARHRRAGPVAARDAATACCPRTSSS